jgi:uncharacterized protein (DUF1697 family)
VEQIETYVALLRGINVVGQRIVPMKQLAEVFIGARCGNVRTYIQSGNVVFTAAPKVAKALPALLAKKIEERFRFSVPVVLRTREELAEVARLNPFMKAGLPHPTMHVYFLADLPAAVAVKSLDPQRSAPDEFHVSGREIYLHLPNGMGRTKLTNAYFDSRLKTVCTARNWNTVLKLLEMMS